jgi:hypothetical protein
MTRASVAHAQFRGRFTLVVTAARRAGFLILRKNIQFYLDQVVVASVSEWKFCHSLTLAATRLPIKCAKSDAAR